MSDKVKVGIDAGHGGSDRANRGPTGYIEADGVLTIAKYLKEALERSGRFEVVMTRDRDRTLSLDQRTNIMLNGGAELLLSIHTNGWNGTVRGPETWISRHETRRDGPLARAITTSIAKEFNVPNRGIKNRVGGSGYNDYHGMIRLPYLRSRGKARPFIIEYLFHDNRQDEAILKVDANLKKMAELTAEAVHKDYGFTYISDRPSMDKVLWKGEIKSNSLNVRQSPSLSGSVVDTLDQGDVVNVYHEIVDGRFKWLFIGSGYVSNTDDKYVGKYVPKKEDDSMNEKGILVNGIDDVAGAMRLARREDMPVYFRGMTLNVKHLFVVGGRTPEGFKGKVTLLSGADFFGTMAEVDKYIKK